MIKSSSGFSDDYGIVFCRSLIGAELAALDDVIVATGGNGGVGHEVAQAYKKERFSRGKQNRLYHVLPVRCDSINTFE